MRQFYRNTALLAFNTAVAFFAINLCLGLAFYIFIDSSLMYRFRSEKYFYKDGSPVNNGKRDSYQRRWIDYRAYGGQEEKFVAEVIDDFHDLAVLGFIYQPWVQFSEPPFRGKRVGVVLDKDGNPTRRMPKPPAGNSEKTLDFFVFGGSTTFGYNVSDDDTWPAYLSARLNEISSEKGLGVRINVTNYGRGYYETSQETVLFLNLLKHGLRPHLAIFMDGLNLGGPEDAPNFTPQCRVCFAELQFWSPSHLTRLMASTPLGRLFRSIRHRMFPPAEPDQNGSLTVEGIAARFLQNRGIARQLGSFYSVETLFFLQPDAVHNYAVDLYRHPPPDRYVERRPFREKFYRFMREKGGWIYLGDLFEEWGKNRKAIVDDVHYSPAFNRFLARHVAAYVDLEGLSRKAGR